MDRHDRCQTWARPSTFPIHDRFTIELGEFEAYPKDHFCRLRIKCHGDRHHVVLPDVDAAIEASDAGDERTELEIVGHYSPRLGALGALEDGLVGHRAVEEAMSQLVADLRRDRSRPLP